VLDFTEVLPKGFNGLRWGPEGADAGTIGFEFRTCDGTVSCMEMDKMETLAKPNMSLSSMAR